MYEIIEFVVNNILFSYCSFFLFSYVFDGRPRPVKPRLRLGLTKAGRPLLTRGPPCQKLSSRSTIPREMTERARYCPAACRDLTYRRRQHLVAYLRIHSFRHDKHFPWPASATPVGSRGSSRNARNYGYVPLYN